jgi:hypothetical protein
MYALSNALSNIDRRSALRIDHFQLIEYLHVLANE